MYEETYVEFVSLLEGQEIHQWHRVVLELSYGGCPN